MHVARLAPALAVLVTVTGAYAQGAPARPPVRPPVAAPKTAARAPVASAKRPAPVGPVGASRGWHTPTPGKTAPLDANGRPQLVLQALNMPDSATLTAASDRGGFSALDLDHAAHILREPSTGNEHPVDPRALDFVYRVATHFSAHEVRIISGYRTPKNGSHSNHGRGRAIDLVVPGASDEDVAKYAREQGFCGVGVYPVSGFVHLDVRERSFFWVDSSGPGKKNRTRGILGDVAARSDQQALARGEHAVDPFGIGSNVDAISGAGQPLSTDDDDDDDAMP